MPHAVSKDPTSQNQVVVEGNRSEIIEPNPRAVLKPHERMTLLKK